MKQNKFQRGFSPLFIILVVVIVGLAAIAVFAIFNAGKLGQPVTQTPAAAGDEQVKSLRTLSGSDEVVDIDKDVSSTNVDALDTGLDQVNNDLNSL